MAVSTIALGALSDVHSLPRPVVCHLGAATRERTFVRRTRAALLGTFALVVAGAAIPATAQNHQGGPNAQDFLHKGISATRSHVSARAESGDSEAEMLRLRAEYEQSIQAAPATS